MSISYSGFDALFLDPPSFVPAVQMLGGGIVRRDAQGQPVRSTGRHTHVYELRTPSGRITALRVHHHADPKRDHGLYLRYTALEAAPELNDLRSPTGPLPRDIRWLPGGLLVPTADTPSSRPVVAMERIPGRTLRQMVQRLCQEQDTAHLALLADRWLQAALAMEAVNFSHGDLSPDNLIVRPDGSIAVVDLDTATWPGFFPDDDVAGDSTALRHPLGLPRDLARRDRFPALMTWASLRILAIHPELPAMVQSADEADLLFSQGDLRRPSASPIFTQLGESNPSLSLLLEVVKRAIRFSPDDLPSLTEIASRLDSMGFPRSAARAGSAPHTAISAPDFRSSPLSSSVTEAAQRPAREQPEAPQPAPAAAALDVHVLEAMQAALVQRDTREARRILAETAEQPASRVYVTMVHQLTEQEAHAAIERAMRRRDDAALLQAVADAEAAGISPAPAMLSAAREARLRCQARDALASALATDDLRALGELLRNGELEGIGPLDPATKRALARAAAWPTVERALASDDDAAICAAADPAIWREEETRPHTVWLRLDLAWHRTRWALDVRAALRRRDGPALRGLMARAPEGHESRLTDVERRRIARIIARDEATTRLERALREGPDREVVEALAELEASGAPFSEVLDWSAVRGVVDRLSLAEALRDAMAADPPDLARMTRLLPAARAALGDMQRAGPEWAELERAVLRAAHLERLREAIASGDDARIVAAADPDPFQVRELLTEDEAALTASALGRTRTQVRRHAS